MKLTRLRAMTVTLLSLLLVLTFASTSTAAPAKSTGTAQASAGVVGPKRVFTLTSVPTTPTFDATGFTVEEDLKNTLGNPAGHNHIRCNYTGQTGPHGGPVVVCRADLTLSDGNLSLSATFEAFPGYQEYDATYIPLSGTGAYRRVLYGGAHVLDHAEAFPVVWATYKVNLQL